MGVWVGSGAGQKEGKGSGPRKVGRGPCSEHAGAGDLQTKAAGETGPSRLPAPPTPNPQGTNTFLRLLS